MTTYYGTDWSESIYGGYGHDVIYAYGGNDLLWGGAGDDILYGGAGDDELYGGSGINDLYGGSGRDWFYMSPRTLGGDFSDDLIRDFEFGLDRIDVSAWGVSDFAQIKALLTTDAYGDATLNAYFDGQDHMLTLADVAPNQLLSSDFIYSTSGARDMTGSGWGDVLFGSAYGDRISSGAGADILLGGAGDDDLIGGTGADRIVGGSGVDLVDYSGSNAGVTVRLNGQASSGGHAEGDRVSEVEVAVGTGWRDVLIGAGADNELRGGGGRDSLFGMDGDDWLIGGNGADRISGGAGIDTVDYSGSFTGVLGRLRGEGEGGEAKGDRLYGVENLIGSAHADTLIGDAGANWLEGGAGNDTLYGVDGDDVLVGGRGNDILTGGHGSDLYRFDGDWGHDTVRGFDAGAGVTDVLRLDSSRFSGFADVMAHTTDTAQGAVISKNGVSITLTGVSKAELAADDFAFGPAGGGAALPDEAPKAGLEIWHGDWLI